MNSFLIIISLILNFVSIFLIVILYLRQNRLYELEKNQEKLQREMEELFSSFILEIREENEEFINKVKNFNNVKAEQIEHTKDLKSITEKNLNNISKNNDDDVNSNEINDSIIRPMKMAKTTVIRAYQQNNQKSNIVEENEIMTNLKNGNRDIEPKSIQDEIITLYQQGYTEEEIAKKLNKGKTEIQLMLKFHQNDQE